MSCHTTAANKSAAMLGMKVTGVTRREAEAAFHVARARGTDEAPPTPEQWQAYLQQQEHFVRFMVADEAEREKVLSRLAAAAAELPDGPSFYAHRTIVRECQQKLDERGAGPGVLPSRVDRGRAPAPGAAGDLPVFMLPPASWPVDEQDKFAAWSEQRARAVASEPAGRDRFLPADDAPPF